MVRNPTLALVVFLTVLMTSCGSSNRRASVREVGVSSPVLSNDEVDALLAEIRASSGGMKDPETGELIEFDEPPEPVHMVAAAYPEAARQAEDEGTVEVMTTIGTSGLVIDTEIHSSNTSADLERAALEAARKWIFKPATYKGERIKVRIVIPFRFTLN